jgi:hypothetical protein
MKLLLVEMKMGLIVEYRRGQESWADRLACHPLDT